MTRPRLTADRIHAAALAVVDADGVPALTMRRVAGDLGVEAMSLYHHVPNKDALVAGVLDLLMAQARLPVEARDVGEWIEGVAAAFRRLGREHPRAYPLLLTRALPLAQEDAALPIERGIGLFVEQGRTPIEAFAAIQSVSLALLPLGLLESESALLQPSPDDPDGGFDLPADRFPLLTGVTAEAVDLDRYWRTLVTALVRGMALP